MYEITWLRTSKFNFVSHSFTILYKSNSVISEMVYYIIQIQ